MTLPSPLIVVSHHCADHGEVRPFVRAMEAAGLDCWFDEDDLPPGSRWLDEIAGAIGRCSGVVLCVGAAGLGFWEEKEGLLAADLIVEKGFRLVPVMLPSCPSDHEMDYSTRLFLAGLQRVDARVGSLQPDPAGRLVAAFKR